MAIIINQPYIETIEDGKVRLCSKIEGDINDILYYEVEKKYQQFLCDDRADAFLIGLLNLVMYANIDVVCEAPVTEELLFQLRTYYIPIVSQNNNHLHNISISADAAQPLLRQGYGVCTGNSGGVDSLYTILKYSSEEMGGQKLTHLVFNNISTADTDDETIRNLFDRDCKEKKQTAKELQLEFVALYSNLYAIYAPYKMFNKYYTAQYVSAIYALAKLFRVFYFSSAYPVEEFSLSDTVVNVSHDSACYDLLSLDCLSTRHLKMYSAGMEADRNQKVAFICDNPVAWRHLHVCAIEQDAGNKVKLEKLNCGNCRKCRRTILQLYVAGKLDEFSEVFDLRAFQSNKGKYIGRAMAADYKAFTNHIKRSLKSMGKLPPSAWIWERIYSFRYFLSRNKKMVVFYHKFFKK